MFNAIYSRVPFLRLLLVQVLGIITALVTGTGGHFLFQSAGIACSGMTVLVHRRRDPRPQRAAVRGILMMASVFCLGAASVRVPVPEDRPPSVMTATVVSMPVRKKSYCRVLLGRIERPGDRSKVPGKMLAYLEQGPADAVPEPGCLLVLYGGLERVPPPLNPFEFDFSSYYTRKGIYYRRYIPAGHWEILDARAGGGLRVLVESWRYRFSRRLEELFPSQEVFAVLNALFLGAREYMDSEDKEEFSRAGAMHFLAVSGLHTGIVFYILCLLFRMVPGKNRPKPWKAVLIALLLWMYALLTGLSASVVRATVMLNLWLIAHMTSREMHPLNNLSVTAFFMLLADPLMIADTGFQLSFLAVGGILLFFPPMYRRLRTGFRIPDLLISLALISLCAQCSTLPLSVFYFHRMSHYFVLTSLLVTPLVTVLLYAAPLFFLSGLLPLLEHPLQAGVSGLAELLLATVGFINELPGSYSEGYYPGPLDVILVFCLVLSSLSLVAFGQKYLLKWVLLSLLLAVTAGTAEGYLSRRKNALLVYHLRGSSAINILRGKDNFLIAGRDLERSYDWQSMTRFWKREHVAPPVWMPEGGPCRISDGNLFIRHSGADGTSIWFLQLGDCRVGIVESLAAQGAAPGGTAEAACLPGVDYLVVTGHAIGDSDTFLAAAGGTTVILDGSNTPSFTGSISGQCRRLGFPVHSTAEQGCFRLDVRAEKIVKALVN